MASKIRAGFSTPAGTALTVWLVLGLGPAIGLAPLALPPAVVPATAPATLFSAERAMQDLEVIAAAPRPIGSARQAEVRDYVLAQIAALGLEGEVQATTVSGYDPAARLGGITAVENLVVRLPGTQSSGTLVLSGHYDSIAATPGGSDCGACVAAVLETLRVLRAGPPLQNDVIVLITDGEEVGIMGAQAFAQQHPLARDVALSVVLEAMGTGGPSILYVSSPQSGALLPQALAALPRPVAWSALNDLMWGLSGNSGSDLDALIDGGQAGLGFVYLASSTAYHTMADRPATIDARSLQHHGEQVTALAQHLGNLDLATLAAQPNAVYFNLLPGVVATYPGTWAVPLAMLAGLAYVVVAVVGLRRRGLTGRGMALGALAFVLAFLAALALVTLAWWLLRLANPNLHVFTVGGWYGGGLYLVACLAQALAVTVALLGGVFGRFAEEVPALRAPAPAVDLPHSAVTILADEVGDGRRQVRLRLEQPVAVLDSYLDLSAPGLILSLAINGQALNLGPAGQVSEPLHLNLYGRFPAGVILDVGVAGQEPATLIVQDRIPALPDVPGLEVAPRPGWMMPAPYNALADSSLIQHRYLLAEQP